MANDIYTTKQQEYNLDAKKLGYPVGYSVTDMQAYLMPRKTTIGYQNLNRIQEELSGPTPFATLTMISVSTHRDKFPVSSLSKIESTGWTSGHRTIAGSMTFSTFDRAVFSGILSSGDVKNIHADEIPLFDMLVLLSDDSGNVSALELFGITILDGSMVLSLDNISPNETYSYMALKMKPLSRREGLSDMTVDKGAFSTDVVSTTKVNPEEPSAKLPQEDVAFGTPAQLTQIYTTHGQLTSPETNTPTTVSSTMLDAQIKSNLRELKRLGGTKADAITYVGNTYMMDQTKNYQTLLSFVNSIFGGK